MSSRKSPSAAACGIDRKKKVLHARIARGKLLGVHISVYQP